ncbi:MAG: hypothetical protein PHO87_05065, partial [Acholeplasmataceae bacterium]|nr:hypothetical protein [Acholeplasmataceae bacterium]
DTASCILYEYQMLVTSTVNVFRIIGCKKFMCVSHVALSCSYGKMNPLEILVYTYKYLFIE